MNIWESIEIIEPYPAVFIPAIEALAIADLHLGYEGIMAEQGMFVPKVQFRQEMALLEKIISRSTARRIILNGDIKHEFSDTSYHEFVEVRDLFEFLQQHFAEVIVIRGNHDNYITRVTRKFDIPVHTELAIGDFLFTHGHRMLTVPDATRPVHVIIGHEHPAVVLYDEVGGKEKISCFLNGPLGGRRLLVLPAFSTLAEGSPVNAIPREAILSPILRDFADIDELVVTGISEEIGALKFPELRKIRVSRS
jgi:putative SbcD/Mre11-related phosphoesterase